MTSAGVLPNADILSDVLLGVRLVGAVYFEVRAGAPWVETAAASHLVAPRLLPGVQHVMSYHVVTQGRCWATIDEADPVMLQAGDVIVFPHGDEHTLSSEPGMRSKPNLAAYDVLKTTGMPLSVQVGSATGPATHIVCGFLGCDLRPFNPLIATLPRILHISDRAGATRGWLNQFIHVALAESHERRPGSNSVLCRLSELMFVEAVRRHLESLPAAGRGWLSGLRDEFVGRALAALHRDPKRPWTIEDLAREAGLSRSAFADRFATVIGRPPMQYLAQWRMQLASGLLARGAKVTQVAFEVGYDSEAAFSRAFKKLTGESPGMWRGRNERAPGMPGGSSQGEPRVVSF